MDDKHERELYIILNRAIALLHDIDDDKRVEFMDNISSIFCINCGNDKKGRRCHCENED